MPDAFLTFLIGAALLLPFYFVTTFSFDRLVRRLHEHHREEWTRRGEPTGFFWKAPGTRRDPPALTAFMRAAASWPFRAPAPLANDPSARPLLLRMRVALLVWNLGLVALVAWILLRHGFPPR